MVHLTVQRLAAVCRREGVGELRPQHIAADGFLHLYINNVRDTLSIAHARVVDELDVLHALHVERLQVLTRSNDAVDAHLHRSQIRQRRDAAHGLVDTDMGQREFCQ